MTTEERARAKTVTYGIIYGLTPFGLAKVLGLSVAAAQDLITSFLQRFSGVCPSPAAWLKHTRQ